MWDQQVDALARDHFVVRYDPRGFGGTRHDPAVPFANHARRPRGARPPRRRARDRGRREPWRQASRSTSHSMRPTGWRRRHDRVGPERIPDAARSPTRSSAGSTRSTGSTRRSTPPRLVRLETDALGGRAARDPSGDLDPAFVRRAHELNAPNIAHATDDGTMLPLEPPAFGAARRHPLAGARHGRRPRPRATRSRSTSTCSRPARRDGIPLQRRGAPAERRAPRRVPAGAARLARRARALTPRPIRGGRPASRLPSRA